jgi:hypothetical protein
MSHNKVYRNLESKIEGLSLATYEPTFTIFDNAIVINYKKLGTRFFETLSTAPDGPHWNEVNENTNQKMYSHQIDCKFQYFSGTPDRLTDSRTFFKTDFSNYDLQFDYERCGHKINTPELLLNKLNIEKFDDIFSDRNRQVIFIIKNPITRFLSGSVQILYTYVSESLKDENERNKLKVYTGLTDTDIKYVLRRAERFFAEDFKLFVDLGHETMEGLEYFSKILHYLLETRFDLLFQDVHTEVFMDYVKTLIRKIPHNNIKILDLDDCNSVDAYKFFETFRNDGFTYSDKYKDSHTIRQSNTYIYDNILDTNSNESLIGISHYLKKEYAIYTELKNSKYFHINKSDIS